MSLQEVWSGLRNALLEDATLVALLGSADAIYRQFPNDNVADPFFVLKVNQANPQTQISGTGLYRPSLQFDVYTTDPAKYEAIYSRLESAWSIPANKSDGITTTNFVITQLQFTNSIEVGTIRQKVDNAWLRMWTILATHRIAPKAT